MPSRILISCPRCTEKTLVDLNTSPSSQRCEQCGMFLLGAETGVKPEPERRRRRKRGWRSIFQSSASKARIAAVDPDASTHLRNTPAWYPLMFLLGIGATILVIFALIKRTSTPIASDSPDIVSDAKPPPKIDYSQFVYTPDPEWTKAAKNVAAAFLKAKSVEEMLPLVADAETWKDEMVSRFAAPDSLPLCEEGVFDFIYTPDPQWTGDTVAMLFFNNAHEDRLQGIIAVKTENGTLVDWPSLFGQGDLSVAEFLQKRPTTPTLLRVAARRTDYHNYEFMDKTKHLCVRLSDFPETHYLYGYVPIDSPMTKRLSRLPYLDPDSEIPLTPKPEPLCIKAHFLAESKSPNQVVITEILGVGWYLPKSSQQTKKNSP